jgi:16S rRNA processing protein RimM
LPDHGEVELGVLAGVFGVRGELKVHLHHADSSWLTRARSVTLVAPDGTRAERTLVVRRGAGKRWIGVISGLTDRDEAAALQGYRIVVPASALPRPAAGEFYVHAILGAEVRVEGARVGRLTEVHAAGPVEVFEIALDAGGADAVAFVPCLKEHVLRVDAQAGVVELAAGAIEGA